MLKALLPLTIPEAKLLLNYVNFYNDNQVSGDFIDFIREVCKENSEYSLLRKYRDVLSNIVPKKKLREKGLQQRLTSAPREYYEIDKKTGGLACVRVLDEDIIIQYFNNAIVNKLIEELPIYIATVATEQERAELEARDREEAEAEALFNKYLKLLDVYVDNYKLLEKADPSYIEPYKTFNHKMEGTLADIHELVTVKYQITLLEHLIDDIERKIEEMKETISDL